MLENISKIYESEELGLKKLLKDLPTLNNLTEFEEKVLTILKKFNSYIDNKLLRVCDGYLIPINEESLYYSNNEINSQKTLYFNDIMDEEIINGEDMKPNWIRIISCGNEIDGLVIYYGTYSYRYFLDKSNQTVYKQKNTIKLIKDFEIVKNRLIAV